MVKKVLLVAVVAMLAMVPQAWAGCWLVEGNAGVGMPIDFSDFPHWGSGFLAGVSLGYMSSPFEIGADASWRKSNPSDDYQTALDIEGADDELRFIQYGAHARLMAPTSWKLSPYLGVGLAAYSVKETYEEPGFSGEHSQTALGVHGNAGLNYWVGPTWGLGADVGFTGFTDDLDVDSAAFLSLTAGIRFLLGSSSTH